MLNKQYALLSQLRLLTRVYGMYNRYVFIRECMPICTNSPKVTITRPVGRGGLRGFERTPLLTSKTFYIHL